MNTKNNNQKIIEIDLKLPKNAKMFYLPDKELYVVRHYQTNVLVIKDSQIISMIDKNQISHTTAKVLRTVFDYFGIDENISYTHNNKFTQELRQVSRETLKDYTRKYNRYDWNNIKDEIVNTFDNLDELSKEIGF